MTNSKPLHLHVPAPPARPGDEPSFKHLVVPKAGETRRPDVAAPEEEMRDLPYKLVRVLDDAGNAVGPWNPNLSPDVLRQGLRGTCVSRPIG